MPLVSQNQIKIAQDEPQVPMTVRQCLKNFARSGRLTDYEKTEILDYETMYFIGCMNADMKI